MTALAPVLQAFFTDRLIAQRRASPHTIGGYRDTFRLLLGFATLPAATGYKLVTDGGTLGEQFGLLNPLLGALFAFASAVLAIKWLITYLERHDLSIFAWYRFGVAGLAVVLLVSGVI